MHIYSLECNPTGMETKGHPTSTPMQVELMPRVDISETSEEYCIEVEMPGIAKEEIEVCLKNRGLTLKYDMKKPQLEGVLSQRLVTISLIAGLKEHLESTSAILSFRLEPRQRTSRQS